MKQVAKLTGVALLGAVFGAACSFIWLSSQLAKAQEFVALVERADLQGEAFTRYRTGDRRVAIYALTRALESKETYVSSIHGQKRDFWDVGLLHARLARVYSQVSDAEQSNAHIERARTAFAQSGWRLRNEEIWSALELIDNNKLSEAVQRYGVTD